MNILRAILIFIVLILCLFIPVQAVDTSYVYSFNTQIVPNATISLLKTNGGLYEDWTTNQLGAYDLDQIKTYLQARWSSLPNGYIFYIQVEKPPHFNRTWKLQKIDATHIKVNGRNTYTTSTVWTYLKNNLRLTEPAGLGYADRTGVTVSSTDSGVRVDGSGDEAKIFIAGDIHYKYTVQHVNDSGNITDEFVVYPQLIDDDWYVVFDADQWSYYTVDSSLIGVGITDMRLVGNTVEITGDGYNRFALQADYANDKLEFWNQKTLPTDTNNPWKPTASSPGVLDYFVAKGILSQGVFHTGDYTLDSVTYFTRYYRNSQMLDTANNYYQMQFYFDNDNGTSEDIVAEIFTPDHIDHFIVEFWNGTVGAYQEVLNDTTYTAANLIHLNNSSAGLDFAFYESGQRGDTVSAIYGNTSKPDQTVSAYYGVINRTLMLFTLPADDGADSATSGASQVKLRLTVYYVDPGYATYEFEDSTNQYYGLDNINGDTMMLYKAGTQNVTYITNESGNAITGMTVRADENELIDRLYITYASTPTNLTGSIINQTAIDVYTDSDGDNVPDAFEDENITANKGQQGGELKWDYIWEGAFNIVNSTGYIYYTNLINGSGLVGTEIQTAGTQNMSMNTARAGETYNFTVNSGTVDWLNVTSGLSAGVKYGIYNTSLIEEQTADASGSVNFTGDLVTGDYWVEQTGISIILLSQTPSTIYKNSTGYLNISYGISHNSSGLNNTSVSFIYRNYDYDLSDSNHSIRPPANDLASEWNFDGRILRAANRNETVGRLNFEDNYTITGGDDYTWSGLDENSTKLTIVPVNSTYTLVYINATVHCIMPQMWYLDRTDQQEATKTQLPIHKTQNVLIKFWNFEIFKGNYDFLGVGYTDTSLSSNPALWPSDANPVNFYYVNSSYDPATGGDPITSGYAVYMGSLNASGWTDHVYSRSNSNYVRGFIDNNYLHTIINTTNISYLYFTSNTESSKPYYINMTNVASSTNVSFANTNTLWAGNTPPYTLQAYTPNIWFAFMKLNLSLDHKLYAADNNDLWGSSTMNRTNITQALFPPTTPMIDHFHFLNETDYDMNGVYYGNFSIGCGVSSDPDGGDVTHNLTLHYANNLTVVTIINNTFTDKDITHNGVYFDANFSSIPYYSQTDNYTLRLIATDDESETVTVWLGVNFSLDGSPRIITYSPETPVSSSEGEIQTFSITTNLLGNVTLYIDSVEVFNETSVNSSSYSNSTALAGVYNVTVVTTNTNGSNSMTWDWTVEPYKYVPLSIFMGIGGMILIMFISSLVYVGIPAIFTSFLGTILAFINSAISVNGQLIQNISGIDSAGNVVQGITVIEVPALCYLFIFIGLIMAGLTIYHIAKEFQYKNEKEYVEVDF